jgi:hypothetical protein
LQDAGWQAGYQDLPSAAADWLRITLQLAESMNRANDVKADAGGGGLAWWICIGGKLYRFFTDLTG